MRIWVDAMNKIGCGAYR